MKEAQELEMGPESSKGRPRQEGEKNKQQKQSPKKTRTKIPLEKGPNLLASRARNGGEHYHPTHAQCYPCLKSLFLNSMDFLFFFFLI